MSGKRHIGQWWDFSDARGIDAQYAKEKSRADEELANATAGPGDQYPFIAPGDTEIKNPGGEFQFPSAMHVAPATATPEEENYKEAPSAVFQMAAQ
jgi:hypothetical protein